MSPIKRAISIGLCALVATLCPRVAPAQSPRATASAPARVTAQPPTPVPTPIPTPVPPAREARQNKGAAPKRRVGRYENRHVSFSRLTRVEEVDLDGDGAFEALVSGTGTFRSLPPDIPAVGFVSRRRLPFENPILAVFKRGKGAEWELLLAGHLPLECNQTDDPAKCDELLAFRSVEFRFDDRPQVALQIVHAGEPRLFETHMYRLDRGRFDTTFSIALPRSAVEVTFDPEGITRRIAVDTFINKELPPRYRSFTLTTTYVFGERKFRIASESLDPEWADGGELDLAYWGLVHQPTFASDLARLQEKQKKVAAEAPWSLDPVELVKKRFPDARDPRVFVKQPGLAIVYFERVNCPAHIVLFQPLREWEGEKSQWDFAVIRSPEEPAYECLAEPPLSGNRPP
jgi:hypothetical protein